jgi:CRP/FNR family transcriptional regulator, cyclic AMP receptor protein
METQNYNETMATRVALHPFLAGMNRVQLTLLADCAISVRFRAGEIILREGERANRVYLIETGKVVLESSNRKGQPVVVDTIGAGDLLGWSWMFPPYIWQFTARAVTPTYAIFFAGPILREYCEHDHSLGFELLKRITAVMTRRMQNARRKMIEIDAGRESLKPVILKPASIDQELDVPEVARNGHALRGA